MSISLEKIFSNLKTYYPGTTGSCKSNAEINDVILLKNNALQNSRNGNFRNSILYLTKASDILKATPDKIPDNILCLCDVPINEETLFPKESDVLLINDKADISELMKIIDKQITYNDKIIRSSAKLLNIAAKNRGIQYIVNNCFDLFGNPIVITDKTFKLLGHTKVDIKDASWNELIQRGHGSYEKYKKLQEWNLKNKSSGIESCVKINVEYTKYLILAANICSHGNIIGHIAMLEYFKPFEDTDKELLLLLSKITASEMEKDFHYSRTKGKMYVYFIQDLIEGKIDNEILVRDKMKYMGLRLKRYIFLMKIVIKPGYTTDEYNLRQLSDILESTACIGQYLVYRDCILCIITRDSVIALTDNEIRSIEDFLNKYKMIAGLSRYFFNIAELKDHYEQSTIALDTGSLLDKNKNLYRYDDYCMHHIIEIFKTNTNIRSMCHPVIEELHRFDKINKTEYCKTLYTYLSNNCNMTKSAKKLFIHTNSMKYRIHKIKGILKMDINDLNNSFILFLSLDITEHYLKNTIQPE